MGAADPLGALEFLRQQSQELGLTGLKIGIITGDEVLDSLKDVDPDIVQTGEPLSKLGENVFAANVYLGHESLVEALERGADLVIGGRIADSSLFLAPLVHEFEWASDAWELLGSGTCVGHLLECGTYLTGGNYADPPYTTVEGFHRPSLPFADVARDGTAVVQKLPGSDGCLSELNCKLQLGYEINDPADHRTPDVCADFTQVQVKDTEEGVSVWGASGGPRPEQLKVLVGTTGGHLGENQVSYGGLGALARARMAEEILTERFSLLAESLPIEEWRIDLLGVNSLHGSCSRSQPDCEPYEVHVRGAARCSTRAAAEAVAAEVEYLMIWGPAGVAAGHRTRITEIASTYSTFIDRSDVRPVVTLAEI
jgi:hypothetical protein